jgi:hypothetical protein
MKKIIGILLALVFVIVPQIGAMVQIHGNSRVSGVCKLYPYNLPVSGICSDIYNAPTGDGVSGVGNGESRNAYRGMYWTGQSITTCGGSVRLAIVGDITGITYKVAVWSVDVSNDLALDTELASATIPGSAIVDGWNSFAFASPVAMPSGSRVILISRVDQNTLDASNHIQVYNGYDESDAESRQWNVHYEPDGTMAGRSAGDEDQPEYFTCDWRLNAYEYTPSPALEYPSLPEDVVTSAASSTSILISWTDRSQNGVNVNHYNVYLYNTSTASKTLIGQPAITSFTHTGLSAGTYTYVVTAVSAAGVEGYHSLKNGTAWSTTLN